MNAVKSGTNIAVSLRASWRRKGVGQAIWSCNVSLNIKMSGHARQMCKTIHVQADLRTTPPKAAHHTQRHASSKSIHDRIKNV